MLKRVITAVQKHILQRKPPTPIAPAAQEPGYRGGRALTPEKQAKLDQLCAQLLSKKSLIVSGKLQLMELTKIKKRFGKQWAGLSKIVYETVEDVLGDYLDKSDIFIRYHDGAYVILFAHASKEEGEAKAVQIADEIRRRLFELDDKALRNIEIRQAINEIRAASLKDGSFTAFLDSFASDATDELVLQDEIAFVERKKLERMRSIDVEAKNCLPQSKSLQNKKIPQNLNYSYMPLWDVRRNALTTYLCLAHRDGEEAFSSYKEIYKDQSDGNTTAIDILLLEAVKAELEKMAKDGRQLLIACPVQHKTLHELESYEQYKRVAQTIPEEQRQFLIFLVVSFTGNIPVKDPYWFAMPLRVYCRHVFAEVPLRRDINFGYLKNTGIDAVGIRVDSAEASEQESINALTAFSNKARAFKIPQSFILGMNTLSLATSSVCAGFGFLGGAAVHDCVNHPAAIHKFRHEDILTALMPQKADAV